VFAGAKTSSRGHEMASDLKYIYLEINCSDFKLPIEMNVDCSSTALSNLLQKLQ